MHLSLRPRQIRRVDAAPEKPWRMLQMEELVSDAVFQLVTSHHPDADLSAGADRLRAAGRLPGHPPGRGRSGHVGAAGDLGELGWQFDAPMDKSDLAERNE